VSSDTTQPVGEPRPLICCDRRESPWDRHLLPGGEKSSKSERGAESHHTIPPLPSGERAGVRGRAERHAELYGKPTSVPYRRAPNGFAIRITCTASSSKIPRTDHLLSRSSQRKGGLLAAFVCNRMKITLRKHDYPIGK